MPLLNIPIAAYERITSSKPTTFPLPIAGNQETLLDNNNNRKGHIVKNSGTTKVTVLYGLRTPDGATELYRFTLAPGDIYLYDVAEIIPYGAISATNNGSIQVIELF
jgi:hypothetical protein